MRTDIDGETAATLNIPDAEGTAFGALHGLFLRSVVTLTDNLGGTQVFTTGATTTAVGMNLDVSGSPVGVTFLTGPGTNDVMTGSDFNDVLFGLLGNDEIFGGAGDDRLMGGGGDDLLDGGAGTDTAHFSVALNDFENIALVPGTSDISIFNDGAAGASTDTLRGIEVLRFGAANFAVVIDGNVGGSTHNGGDGSQALFGGAGNDTLLGALGDDIIIGGAGNDNVRGGNGNDWFFQTGATDGRDMVRGGDDTGIDTYVLSGVAGAEAFGIFTRNAFLTANPGAVLNGVTEIVVTRNGTVIAELDGIEEIKVNSLLTTNENGNGIVDGGLVDGDTVTIVGDFTQTDLDYNTIRVTGSNASDTVDISGLQSDHRLVFTTNGGADAIVGAVRTQDIINGAVNDLRTTEATTFGAQDGLDAMVGRSVQAAMIGGSSDGGMPHGRTMIEMDPIVSLDTVETAPVAPVFVNDAPVDLGGGDQRSILTDYPVS